MVDVLLRLENDDVLSEIGIQKGAMDMINREQMIAIRTTLAGLPRTQTPGGSVCNTMRSMSSLGANSGFIGKIGDDSIGGFYEDALEKAGVSSYFIKTDGLTGSCTVMISPDGERTMGTFLGPAPTITPDEITEELIDVIAAEPKIVKYLDIPIQHCNDGILKAMNRRDTKAELLALFENLRARIPGLVLRTSLITGLPGEGEAELEELCVFLRETKIERAGVFPFSPEEGTRAARMDHVDMEEARRRAELVVDVQSDIIDAYNESVLGTEREVLCEGFDSQAQMHFGRSYAESPDIDGRIWFDANREVEPGTFVTVRLTGVMDGELTGELAEE